MKSIREFGVFQETIDLLHGHHSDRLFSSDPVSEDVLDAIIKSAYRGPTSINGQHVSVVVVRDPARRARIAYIAGGQAWIEKAPVFITLVVDFQKTRTAVEWVGKRQLIHESLEGFAVGTLDAGIALANLMVSARAHGLGIVPIGGIRKDPQAMIDLLLLPPLTFPVVGLCIGHVEKPAPQKPRLPISTFRHDEVYHPEAIANAIHDYDQEMLAYWQSIGRSDGLPWSANTASFYERIYFPKTAKVARTQGFSFDN